MSVNLRACLKRFHLQDEKKVQNRAEEFLGKFHPLGNVIFDKGGPNCKVVIAIQLACESLQITDWDIKIAAAIAGCSLSTYESVLSTVRKALDIQPSVSFKTLAVTLGSTGLVSLAQELWTDFVPRYLDVYTGARRQAAEKEVKSPCWKGAVMFSCAKAFGERLKKDDLRQLCGCTAMELNLAIKSVDSFCAQKLTEFKKRPNALKRVAPQDKNEEKTEEERIVKKMTIVPVSGISSMIDHRDYKATKRYKEYMSWHTSMVQQLKEQKTK